MTFKPTKSPLMLSYYWFPKTHAEPSIHPKLAPIKIIWINNLFYYTHTEFIKRYFCIKLLISYTFSFFFVTCNIYLSKTHSFENRSNSLNLSGSRCAYKSLKNTTSIICHWCHIYFCCIYSFLLYASMRRIAVLIWPISKSFKSKTFTITYIISRKNSCFVCLYP